MPRKSRLAAIVLALFYLVPIGATAQFPSNFTVKLTGAYNPDISALCADPTLPNTFYAAYHTQTGSIIAMLDGNTPFNTLELNDNVVICDMYKVNNELFFCRMKMIHGTLKTAGVVGHVSIVGGIFSVRDVCVLDGGINRVQKIVASDNYNGTYKVLALGSQDANNTIYPTQLLVNEAYYPGDFLGIPPYFASSYSSQISSPYGERIAEILDCGADWVLVGSATEPTTGEPCISIRLVDKVSLSGILSSGVLLKLGHHNYLKSLATHISGGKIAIAIDDFNNCEQVVYTYDYMTKTVLSAQKIIKPGKGAILDLVYLGAKGILVMARQGSFNPCAHSLVELKPYASTGYGTVETEPVSIALINNCAVSHTTGCAENLLAVFDGYSVYFRDYLMPMPAPSCYTSYPLEVQVEKIPSIETIPAMTPASSVGGSLVTPADSSRYYITVCP